jgi:hypothetical protein
MRMILGLSLLLVGCGGSPPPVPPPMQSGPVDMKNASVRQVGTGEYSITFVLDNQSFATHKIARADLVRLDWGGQLVRANINCDKWPFVPTVVTNTAQPGQSDVITVGLNLTSDKPTATTSCGGGNTIPTPIDGAPAGAPKSGDSLVVAVDGILDDATPFTAAAMAPVL